MTNVVVMSQFPPPVPAPPAVVPEDRALGWIAAIGGVVAAGGSLLPWETVTTVFGSVELAGTKGDGKWTAALGVAVVVFAVLGVVQRLRGPMVTAAVLAGVGVAVSVWDLAHVQSRAGELSSDTVGVDVGIGLFVCVGGFVAALVFALVAKQHYAPMVRAQFPDGER